MHVFYQINKKVYVPESLAGIEADVSWSVRAEPEHDLGVEPLGHAVVSFRGKTPGQVILAVSYDASLGNLTHYNLRTIKLSKKIEKM